MSNSNIIIDLVDILFGFSAAYNTFVYIPQIIRLIKIKKSEELSLTMFLLFNITLLIQILYTALIAYDYEYAIGNSFVLLSCAIVTYLIVYYRIRNLIINHQSEKTPRKENLSLVDLLISKTKETIIENKKQLILAILILIAIIGITYHIITLGSTSSEFTKILTTLFCSGFIIVGSSFILQIVQILRQKHAEEFSIITFAGFNVIQVIIALYAYFHHTWSLFLGMIFYLLTSGALTLVILFYKWKNNEFKSYRSA